MNTKQHDLHTFMAQVTCEMASEYGRIFAKTADDPGTAGDEGEENWAQLLRDWLPPAYHVTTKGRLIASDGAMSPQIDVLVLKPFYPGKLREKKVWLANGVAAAFECKTTLRTEHISASADRCKAFKALFARQTGSPARELRSSLFYGVLAHSHAWKAPGSKPGDNVDKALTTENLKAAHPTDLIDLVCIADVGCWSGMVMPRYEASWNPPARTHLEAIFGGTWGPVSSMMRSSIDATDQHEAFQPVGGMLAYLTQRLAWENPAIRDLADYYRLTNMWGQGQGEMRFWPQTVLSEEVRQKIVAGAMKNEGGWNEWNAAII
jgi:hypothetical protein